jgi:outer membrane protein W
MKKHILLISYFFLLQIPLANAQLRIGLSPSLAYPIADLGSINKNGYGLSLTGKYQLSPKFSLTANFSYFAFGRAGESLGDLTQAFGLSPSTVNLLTQIGADTLLKIPNVDFMPVNVGFEYYMLSKKKISPYVGFDIGVYFTHTENIELNLSELIISYFESLGQNPPPVSFGSIDLTASDANFGMAPLVGVLYKIHEHWNIDLNIKANGIIVPDKKAAPVVMTFSLGFFYRL